MAPSMNFGGGGATDSEFEYFESGVVEEPSLEFNMESREEPLNISLCGGRYAVVTFATKVMMIDLARARERILYNHYFASLQSGHSVSQQLLFPELLTLTEEEFELVEEYAVDFASLGFDIKLQGENTIAVAGLPADVHTEQLDRAIYDLIQSLKLPQSVVELRRSTLAQTLAHSEAVGVVRFSQEETERITKQILDSEECYTPMGKRIMTVYTVSDIKNTLE